MEREGVSVGWEIRLARQPSDCASSIHGLQASLVALVSAGALMTPTKGFPCTMSTICWAISQATRRCASLVLAPRWGVQITCVHGVENR